MNIKELIKENYEIAKSKGFYPDDSKIEDHLMGIVSELGEAYEAHRGGKFATSEANKAFIDNSVNGVIAYDSDTFRDWYKYTISGTFEDEIADVFIRLFNLCGFLNISNFEEYKPILSTNNLKHTNMFLLVIVGKVEILKNLDYGIHQNYIAQSISFLEQFCKYHNIDYKKHIQAKKEYNKTRPNLHGKKY